MLTTDEAEALFTRRREAWLREDLDGYLDCWTDDTIFESPVHREPIRGREAYAALVRASASTVRPLRFDVAHLAVRGDVVLAEWEIEAEHRASGARLRWRGMSVAGYRDGRIAWWREYWNPAALGLPA
jgi:ketosteroid isomerase-like protein